MLFNFVTLIYRLFGRRVLGRVDRATDAPIMSVRVNAASDDFLTNRTRYDEGSEADEVLGAGPAPDDLMGVLWQRKHGVATRPDGSWPRISVRPRDQR